MALTRKTTDKLGLGRLTVYMKNGDKTTESVDCSRKEATNTYLEIQKINGMETELVRVLFNGKQIFPEKTTMSTNELCEYLPEHPNPNTVKGWVRMKKIPFHKAGQAKNSPTYFKISEIDKWLQDGRTI